MADKNPSPCVSCKRRKEPNLCESKCCRDWQEWWLARWECIHRYGLRHLGRKEGKV